MDLATATTNSGRHTDCTVRFEPPRAAAVVFIGACDLRYRPHRRLRRQPKLPARQTVAQPVHTAVSKRLVLPRDRAHRVARRINLPQCRSQRRRLPRTGINATVTTTLIQASMPDISTTS
jgi:hypothetical protein